MKKTDIKLSVTIITYNEEDNIARCLESVVEVADEIVVVDSVSKDKTRAIAEKYPVRFIEHPFEGYIEQKNFALSVASFSHILALDADEALSEELKAEIIKIKSEWSCDGYYMNRLSSYCGKWIRHGAWHPDYKLRLFDRGKGKWDGLNPHDHFVLEPGTKTCRLKGKILHYTYHTIGQQVEKMNHFSEIQAGEYYRYGVIPGFLKIFFHSGWRFFRDYFIKGGFLDGFYGLIIAINSAHEAFLKYIKLRDLYKKVRNSEFPRILMMNTNRFWGGGEKWNLEMACFLLKNKHDVFFVTSSSGALSKKISEHKVPVFKLNTGFAYYLNIFYWCRIIRLMKFFKPDTVVVSLSNDLKLISIPAGLSGIKRIIYRRGISVPVTNSFSNRILYRKIVTGIVANSNETKRNILLGNPDLVPGDKIKVIHNGINTELLLQKSGVPLYERSVPGEIVLGNAGRLSLEKGQAQLIDLALKLKGKQIPFQILIAGEGELFPFLEYQIKEKNLDNEVKLLGFIEKMEDFYASIDVFILTSKHEGFGYVLLEAGLSKIPVISFDIGSSAEIIINGESGYLVPPGDTASLAEKIIAFYEHPHLIHEMGEKAFQRVKEHFNQKKSFAEYLKILE
ncbi:MAG: glycosyltransferase [Chlorobi bacterium]|nr:glycosyltransferase [Chlorobiota bacterium]